MIMFVISDLKEIFLKYFTSTLLYVIVILLLLAVVAPKSPIFLIFVNSIFKSLFYMFFQLLSFCFINQISCWFLYIHLLYYNKVYHFFPNISSKFVSLTRRIRRTRRFLTKICVYSMTDDIPQITLLCG